ncbi:MAG: hypothetical protein CBC46_06640 [Verrucomicrobiaceae bacterium TMED86]|nr:MAG: hypothetical protein CBC46_06640 [Verrucomicrobiaceae bacterium TMED86]
MSKRTSPGSKKRKLTAEKRTTISRKDAAAKRCALTKRVMEVTSRASAQSEEKSRKPPAKFQTTTIPVKKTAVKRASPAKKTPVKQAAQKSRSFETFNKSGEPKEQQAPQRSQEEAYQPKPQKSVRVRKETIRGSLETPSAKKIGPMENWDILKPGKLAEVAKEDPDHKYAPPGLHETPAANLHQASAPAPTPEPEPEPEPEQTPPLSLDQALPLRKEKLRVPVKVPFAGMAAARAAAAREPILSTQAAAPEPEPAPKVVLEQTTASVTVSAQPPPAQPGAPEQPQPPQSQLNTPLPPQPIQPKRDLGSILMTGLCAILGIIAAVMIYLAFFT